jgi:hypothetical protein
VHRHKGQLGTSDHISQIPPDMLFQEIKSKKHIMTILYTAVLGSWDSSIVFNSFLLER